MAMIKCPECGKEISDKANACIHCGCPLETKLEAEQCKPEESIMNIEKNKRFNFAHIVNLLTILGLCFSSYCFNIILQHYENETGGWLESLPVEQSDAFCISLFAGWAISIVFFAMGLIIWIRKKPSPELCRIYLYGSIVSIVAFCVINWEVFSISNGGATVFIAPYIIQVVAGILYGKPCIKKIEGFILAAIPVAVLIIALLTSVFSKPFYVGDYRFVDCETRWFFDAPDIQNGSEIDLNGNDTIDPSKISLTVEKDTCYFYFYGETYVGSFKKAKSDFMNCNLSFDKEPPTVNEFYLSNYRGEPSLDGCNISIYEYDGKIKASIDLVAANETITDRTVFCREEYKFYKIES